jgi:hypothetical protein
MEEMNLENLSLFLTDEMVIIPEELQKISLSQKFKNNGAIALHEEQSDYGDIQNGSQSQIQIEDILSQVKGQFEKGIVIIYEGHNLEEAHQEFLMKILGAVNCSLKDIALIGADLIEELPEESINILSPTKIIVFGLVHHPIMQHKQDTYRITQPSYEIMFADDLKDIFENVALKKQLWGTLQVLFQIKK